MSPRGEREWAPNRDPSPITRTFNDNDIRIVEVDGEPWFVAKDVCDALEHSNSRMALKRLDDDERGVSSVYTPGGNQEMQVINEAGVYRLIFTSRKPEVEQEMTAINEAGTYRLNNLSIQERRCIYTNDNLPSKWPVEAFEHLTRLIFSSKKGGNHEN